MWVLWVASLFLLQLYDNSFLQEVNLNPQTMIKLKQIHTLLNNDDSTENEYEPNNSNQYNELYY